MHDELLQFKLQKVWTLVDLPYGKRAIGTKWVYRNKKDERGIVIRKARLVAQGYTQEEGIDYDEVFAPIARIEAIRLFLAYAPFKEFVVYLMDVKIAFLYGKIEKEVYVCQPPGFEDPEFPDRVYKVEKALYGLHQAPRAWKELCTEFEKMMHKKFQMSSMGELTFFVGLQVTQKDDGIFISQDKYVDEILKKFGFSTVKTASTPIVTSKPLMKDENAEDVDVHLYRSMIGSLMYLTALRPDIMFVVCACARFQVTPKVSHLHAMKRIFRYLKGQPKLGLWYPKDSPFDLEAYTNSDYAGASLDRKSTTKGCQFLGSRLISWQCKKQTIVANSTTKAKYVAASSCCGQAKVSAARLLTAARLPLELQLLRVFLEYKMKTSRIALKFVDSHNMVAYLEKSTENNDFDEIVDFLNASSIRYALTLPYSRGRLSRREGDILERAATTAASLDAEQTNVGKGQVYVCQPQCLKIQEFPDEFIKVGKSALYGLIKLREELGMRLYLPIYWAMDFIEELCTKFEKMMHKKFQMSSMGELTFFVGLAKWTQKDDGIFISQDKYVDEILKKFGFSTVKTASTPIVTSKPLMKDENTEDVDVHLYRSMIGSLMYLTALRPDIIIYSTLRSDYAGASLDRKSTTKGCQFLGSRLISWQCKKQTIVANSTAKAKYVAASCYGQAKVSAARLLTAARLPLELQLLRVFLEYKMKTSRIREEGRHVVRAATTAASLDAEQDNGSGPRRQDTILGDKPAQTRFERLSKQSNDPPLLRVNTLRDGEDRMQLQELMEMCTKLSDRVLDLESVKVAQALEIKKLKKRVKKLESRKRSRTLQLKRRLFKERNEIDQDEGTSWFQEDAETQGRYSHDAEVTTTSAPFILQMYLGEEWSCRKREEEANLVSWDNTQAMMEADYELAQRLQAEEQGEITIEEISKLFIQRWWKVVEARQKEVRRKQEQYLIKKVSRDRRTRIVEENMHVKFDENIPNIAGSGPNWLFDIDALTKSMNYEPVIAGKYSKDSPDAGFKPSREEEKKDAEHPENEDSEVPNIEELRVNQEQDANVNSTNNINIVSPTVNVAGIKDNDVDENIVYGCADDPNMPNLEEIVYSDDDDEGIGAKADMTNLDTNIPVSPIPTTRIHKDQPFEQIIGDIHLAPQTRKMTRNVTNHDLSWIEAMHDELLQFKLAEDSPFDLEAYTDSDYADASLDINLQQKRIQFMELNISLNDEHTRSDVELTLLLVYTGNLKVNDARQKVSTGWGIISAVALKFVDSHNMVAYLEKSTENNDFDEIVDFLNASSIRYALTLPYSRGRLSRREGDILERAATTAASLDAEQTNVGKGQVYVCQPQCLKIQEFPDEFIKVGKSALYGLIKLREELGMRLYLPIYWTMDFREELCTKFEKMMHKKFQMSSMGELTFFVGLAKWTQKDDGIFISQDKYVDEILKKFGFSTVKTASTPIVTSKPLMKDENTEDVDVHLYRSMIGSLMYLTALRPDIMFVVCACARFQVTPKVSHLHSMKQNLYDYAGASLDRKSTTKGCQFLGSRLISWQCKKQTIVANSTTKAKYVAASCCGQAKVSAARLLTAARLPLELQLLRVFLEYKMKTSRIRPTTLIADETIQEERGDNMERAATTAASLDAEQDNGSGPRRQDTILGDKPAQTRFERLSKQSNDPPLLRVNTLGDGEDRMQLQELMEMCTKLSDRVLDLESVKVAQALEIKKLKKRVKKLESRKKSRTLQLKRRLFKERNEIDQDEGTSWFQEDAETQGRYSHDAEVTTASAPITTADVSVSTAEPSTPPTTTTLIEDEDFTIAQTLMKMRSEKSKEKSKEKAVSSEATTRPIRGVVMREVSETASRPIVPSQQQLDPKDKGKGIMQEPKKQVKVKGKDQIVFDEEIARRLEAEMQVELEEEERVARKREEEANLVSWDNTQAMMEADYELAQRLQAEEHGEITIEEIS
ncbi:putative ribonuclease H-like domain-containing protein [Tanacetum coccineum]|uniref:Ribonuclease H-like domain-containing protein n=1 Tax=Tanacetum coccineum TaxID=301880 RepID=A0ABQ5IJU9_9ASTR